MASSACLASMSRPSSSVRRARPLLGTLAEIRLPREASGAIEGGFEALERVHRLMSRQDSESDVARINAASAGSVISIDPWTMAVLRRAKEVHALTGGLFHWEPLEMLESAVHVKQRVHLRSMASQRDMRSTARSTHYAARVQIA